MLPLLVLSVGVEDILRSSYTKHFTYGASSQLLNGSSSCGLAELPRHKPSSPDLPVGALITNHVQVMQRRSSSQLASEVCCEGKEKETISSFSVGTTETRLEEAVVCTSSKEEGVLEEPDANATSIVCSASGKLEVSLQLWMGRGLVSKIPLLFSFILQKYLRGCKCRTLCY